MKVNWQMWQGIWHFVDAEIYINKYKKVPCINQINTFSINPLPHSPNIWSHMFLSLGLFGVNTMHRSFVPVLLLANKSQIHHRQPQDVLLYLYFMYGCVVSVSPMRKWSPDGCGPLERWKGVCGNCGKPENNHSETKANEPLSVLSVRQSEFWLTVCFNFRDLP